MALMRARFFFFIGCFSDDLLHEDMFVGLFFLLLLFFSVGYYHLTQGCQEM